MQQNLKHNKFNIILCQNKTPLSVLLFLTFSIKEKYIDI